MPSIVDLERILARIDKRGYKAYKDLEGRYEFDFFTLFIDHVQGDPFASPSKIRVRVPQRVAKIPEELFKTRIRRIALEDLLARKVRDAIGRFSKGRRGTGASGLIVIASGGQEVLERTAVVVNSDWVEARLYVGLPASGRRILGALAREILREELPRIVEKGLVWRNLNKDEALSFVGSIENQEYIRDQLDRLNLVAFVADGSILPRESGASDLPMSYPQAVPFRSPESLRVSFQLPNPIFGCQAEKKRISGMGIPKGVTLIVGGGFHGKSTLLRAIERGVYPHIPRDGREYVVTTRDAVKIRAEDGRRVEKVDISSFISDLPLGKSTRSFSTDDASGSTSQAANIMEALEVGVELILLDEDTSATNFMIRDRRMQALVHKEDEPITPFLDRVRELYERFGVSTLLVMGGSGDYFDVADTVIMMREYLPFDVTSQAKKIAGYLVTGRKIETLSPMPPPTPRVPLPESFNPQRGKKQVKIEAKGLDLILFGKESIDLRRVEQLVDIGQARAIGNAIYLARRRFMDGQKTLREVVDLLDQFFDREGLDPLDPFYREGRHPGSFARPRRYEIAAAINRGRSFRLRPL